MAGEGRIFCAESTASGGGKGCKNGAGEGRRPVLSWQSQEVEADKLERMKSEYVQKRQHDGHNNR